ncbi:MAG: thioredoxin family protein [Meiothermus sp.]|uniref:thioredoxin fold domain-containing protein n=1 Tax=Meiothermus sp. TaxID=1955249 RepID=UPI0025E2138E|nr:thioredoxin family protein [Meiothermus sp.]MCS7058082.1 thioredoxin family protein [Meiothermus sp.]MCS7194047.1 thioredoxin family protein [Meiothermus sp.]MDW8091177.1 thioredoxin family protein [Meiothermus sp.]MDW8480446.1 thioredoxin family protein [Meiothermus sp.]
MRTVAVFALGLGALLTPALAGPVVDFDRWYPYPQAQQYAQAYRRILMVYFWGHGCPYCEQMNTFVLSDGAVSRILARRYVVASVDAHSPEGQSLSRQMRAFGTPTFVFLVPHEGAWKEIGRLFGSRPRAQFLRELEQFCAKAGGEGCE